MSRPRSIVYLTYFFFTLNVLSKIKIKKLGFLLGHFVYLYTIRLGLISE